MAPPAGLMEAPERAAPRGAECRVRERHSCGLQTSCQPIAARGDKDCLWPAEVRDISELGVGLVLRRRFERGTGLAVEIPGPDGQVADTLLAKVVHVTNNRDGSWLLGCHFVSELSGDEMQRLLQLATQQREASDSAHSGECASGTTIEELAEAANAMILPSIHLAGTTEQGGEVRQIVRRFYLKGSWPLQAGTLLRLKIFKAGQAADPLTIRITECVKEEKSWIIRYQLVGSPPPEAASLLGHGV